MDFEKRFRVPDHGFSLGDCDPGDHAGFSEEEADALRERHREHMVELQARLYAEGERSLLLVFQALDAAGKDGTIKHVMSCLDPQGVTAVSFKQPSHAELAHDFLWRVQLALPARGDIGIFNRSHYEEVLVVRVHPEYLVAQAIDPDRAKEKDFWDERYEAIGDWERHLGRDGTRVVKFFLHISRGEQRERFLARAEEQEKNWKFSAADVEEHFHYDAYQEAYDAALKATSTKDAPWYVIPADHKWFMRAAVAEIVVHHLEDLDPHYPKPSESERAEMAEAVKRLREEA